RLRTLTVSLREYRHPPRPRADAPCRRYRRLLPGARRRRDGQGAGVTEPKRCWRTSDPGYNAYHDQEWGRPVTDERGVLEALCLEGFQSGLSWLTILRKRDNFRVAFANFDPEVVARYGEPDVQRLPRD